MFIIRLKGGLGNQMFQYAFAKSKSLSNKEQFLLDLRYLNDRSPRKNFVFRNYDLDIFDIKPDFYKFKKYIPFTIYFYLFYELFLKIIVKIFNFNINLFIENNFKYDLNAIKYNKSINYYIGYFQSFKYFEKYEEEIRKDFTFKNKIDINSHIEAKEILSNNSVCINIRRGDFLNDESLGVKSTLYYLEGIKQLNSITNLDNLIIYVFSDDIDWCKENLNFSYQTKFMEHSLAGYKFSEYLQLMTFCKYFIIPNSSFAWWAAYLSSREGKVVIVPEKWHNYHNDGDDVDLILDSWVRIKN